MTDQQASDPRQITVYQHVGQEEPPPLKPTNPRHLSKDSTHRTPLDIVEKARSVLGDIDLDPFSSAEANEAIKASTFFDGKNNDGFCEEWNGRVFCNPPGGKIKNDSNQKRAWFKLVDEYRAGRVTSAFFVCFSIELLQTTQSKTPPSALLPLDFPICFPKKRIAYLGPDGKVGRSPPHSSCFVLLPFRESGEWDVMQVEIFRRTFESVGRVIVPSYADRKEF